MATYLQWARTRPARRVTWVCGPEPCLARDVVLAHREGALPDQCLSVFAGDSPEREIWDLLLTPPPGGRRVTVYGAERLRFTGNVALLASDGMPESCCTVLVSSAPDFEREGSKLVPHLAVLQAARCGQLVRCCEPSKLEDRVRLVASWWPGATPNFAYDVLTRCGSLERARLACDQAVLAGLQPTPAALAATCPREEGGELADLLMAGNKSRAMTLAVQASRGELGAVIGLLAARLSVAEQLAEAVRSGMQPREAVQQMRAERFAAGRVAPYLSVYGAPRISRCRRLLAFLEAAWRAGAGDGVAESLVALW